MAYDATAARFDVLRKRLQEEKSRVGSEQEEALKRRYASQGMLQSGAYLKGQEEQAQKLEEMHAKGMQDISMAQDAEVQRQNEIKEGRQYATSEREASQAFNEKMMGQQLDLSRRELDENIKTNRINAQIAFKNAGINEADFERINSQLSEFYDMIQIGPDGKISYRSQSPAGKQGRVNNSAEKIWSSLPGRIRSAIQMGGPVGAGFKGQFIQPMIEAGYSPQDAESALQRFLRR